MEESNLKRRNLSGIYIFDTFPTDEKPTATCVEDCRQRTRRDWCATKEEPYLKQVVERLTNTYKELCECLYAEGEINHVVMESLVELIGLKTATGAKYQRALTDTIDYLSKKITTLADSFGAVKEN